MTDQQTLTGTLPLLTASRLRDARACQRLHYFKYGLGYRPVEEAETLRFGSLVHAALEAWWLTPGDDERLDAALAALTGASADAFDQARAEAAIRGYHERWIANMALYDVVGVEVPFNAPLINPETGAPSRTWRIAGKVDAILSERATGRILICEHKTSAEECSPGSDYMKRLRLDSQVSTYFIGVESLSLKPDAVLYDVLRKTNLRPYKATPVESRKYTKDGRLYATQRENDETAEEFRDRCVEEIASKLNDYYVRAEVVRLEAEVVEAMADVWQTGRILHENSRRGFYPRTVEACTRYGRTCPFFAVCCNEASLEDPSLYRKVDDVNPELGLNGNN